jgi:signal transduction histidine kinase
VAPQFAEGRSRLSRVARKLVPRSRVAPGQIPIRYKLAAAMGVPTLALSLFTVYEVAGVASDVEAVERQSELATSADGPTALIIAIQNERNWAVTELFGQGGIVDVNVAGYDETRADTDAALEGFREELSRSQDETIAAYAPAIEGLSELQPLRDSIDNYPGPRTVEAVGFANEVFAHYKAMIEPFLEGTSLIADVVGHADLGQGAALLDTSLRQIETIANLVRQTIIYGVLSEGGLNRWDEIAEVSGLRDRFRRYATRLHEESTGIYAAAVDEQVFGEWTTNVGAFVDNALQRGVLDMGAFLDMVTLPEDESYLGYEKRVGEILTAKADDLNDAAAARRQLYLLVILGVGSAALAAMWVMSHSITRSLRKLTGQAADVAHRRLPSAVGAVLHAPSGDNISVPATEPVWIGTRDEVADVASALNTVQQSALNLAVGQAVLRRNIADSFINLGRRNQNLLNRQLSFITELERGETDPDNLANLFHLDHLATRMRRNAESLLVLGGVAEEESPSHSGGPVRISDVIRAAVSEVEDYQRVVAPTVEPVRVAGNAGSDLVHLLAELVDNALTFSPPNQSAEIRGLGHHAGYTLTVIDQGLGMRPDEIAQANRRLAGSEPFTVAPSKYLGHYVAGHLAARHGVQVRLQGAPGHGVTATVHLPTEVLVPEQPARQQASSVVQPGPS